MSTIPRSTVLAFGFGGVSLGVVGTAVSYFLLIYYNQVLGMPAHLVGLALAVALVADAIVDPLVGLLSDRTRTVWGRRHPYMYATLIPLPLLYFFLWNPPTWALATDLAGFGYLTALLIVFRTVLTCFATPSSAMVPEITRDYDERTALMSALVSTAWVAGVSLTIAMYAYFLQPTEAQPDGVLNAQGYQSASRLGAALVLLSVGISAVGTHQHVPTLRQPRPTSSSGVGAAFQTARAVFSNRPFRALMLYAVAYRSTDGLFAALWVYLVTYFWRLDPDQIALLSAMNLIGAAVAMWVTPRLARNHDKRTIALAANSAILITGCAPITLRLMGWLPDPWVFPSLMAIGVAEVFLVVVTVSLLASMIADIVEDVQKSSGSRHEGVIVSVQTFVAKLSTASGTWLAGLVLSWIAFPESTRVADVSRETTDALGLTYVLVLYASIAVCAALLLRYKLDRIGHEANLAALAASDTR